MNKITLNLADLYFKYAGHCDVLYDDMIRLKYDRVMIGSYFCVSYMKKCLMVYANELHARLLSLNSNGIHVSLVVPLLYEDETDFAKSMVTDAIRDYEGVLDEIVVNDIGMFSFINQLRYEGVFHGRIIAGRLFFKNFRDLRNEEYYSSDVRIFCPEFLMGSVDAAELDIISKKMNISEFGDISIRLHYPYSYVTCSRMCEFAIASNPQNLYTGLNIMCRTRCMTDGYFMTEAHGMKLYHEGKGVYSQPDFSVEMYNTEKETLEKPEQFLYWPLEEILRDEYISAF